MLVRVTMPPGQAHKFHRHPAMEEIIYVVDGQAEQWVDREKRLLGPGEMAHIPTDVVHGTYNAGVGNLVFLAILSPAIFEGPALVDVSARGTVGESALIAWPGCSRVNLGFDSSCYASPPSALSPSNSADTHASAKAGSLMFASTRAPVFRVAAAVSVWQTALHRQPHRETAGRVR